MQKFIACFICILALLSAAMPVIIAEDNQSPTVNNTLNQTQNATENITLNETENASENRALNETQNATQSTIEGVAQNIAQNTTQIGAPSINQHAKVLRAGFEKSKPLNNLDVYGNKSTYNIPTSAASSAFNASQRQGNTSKITFNPNINKPIYNVSQYSRTKPIYEVPSSLSSKPVYNISGYPVIKAPNSIP
jgi:hypothetical protein